MLEKIPASIIINHILPFLEQKEFEATLYSWISLLPNLHLHPQEVKNVTAIHKMAFLDQATYPEREDESFLFLPARLEKKLLNTPSHHWPAVLNAASNDEKMIAYQTIPLENFVKYERYNPKNFSCDIVQHQKLDIHCKHMIFSPSGTWLAISTTNNTLLLYSLTEKKIQHETYLRPSHENTLCFSPDGQFIAYCTITGSVEVWYPFFNKHKVLFQHVACTSVALSISANGKFLISSNMNSVILWSFETKESKWRIDTQDLYHKVAFTQDSTRVACVMDNILHLYRVEDGKTLRVIQFSGFIHSLFSPANSSLLYVSVNDTIYGYDPFKFYMEWKKAIGGPASKVKKVLYSHDASICWIVYKDGCTECDLENNTQLFFLPNISNPAMSHDNHYVCSAYLHEGDDDSKFQSTINIFNTGSIQFQNPIGDNLPFAPQVHGKICIDMQNQTRLYFY